MPWKAVLLFLVLLSALAALPGDPAGPFDPRSGARADGFVLEMPATASAIEPFAAPFHALAGAPDYRLAAVSTLVWVALFPLFVVRPTRRALAACGWAIGLFACYVLFCALVPLPSWRLRAKAPGTVIADLQTHTLASHDGIVSAEDNLELHAARGCDVVAVTEHDDSSGSYEALDLAEAAPGLPAVLPGVELRERGGGYLLGLGTTLSRKRIEPEDLRDARKFVAAARRPNERFPDGGAVLALSWKLKGPDVSRLVSAGVDGFEIANFGHPVPNPDAEAAMLLAQSKHGLHLVSSSDWHGWSGAWRTWTAFRVPPGTPKREFADVVLEILRERRTQDVLPLTAGRLGQQPLLRTAFAPVIEAVRYARELSWERVLSWWIWAGLLLAARRALLRVRLRPGRVGLIVLLAVLGTGLVIAGASLLLSFASGETSTAFPARIGAWGAAAGSMACMAGAVLSYLECGGPHAKRT
ncbi:MAG: hypothetical protein WC728_02185 [Elusimicrobiota bacterium]